MVLDLTGDTLDLELVSTWTHILDAYGEETATEIFDRVLAPERVCDRTPYPGSTQALRYVQEKRDVKVHFISRNHNAEAMTPHLEPWL